MSPDVTIAADQGGRDSEIAGLVLSIQNDEAGLALTLDDQPDLSDIPAAYASGGFWVATVDDAIVGCIGLLVYGRCGVLKKLFVAAQWRGASGLAAGLLDTPAVATRSHGFYRKAGFTTLTSADLPPDYAYPDRNSLIFGRTPWASATPSAVPSSRNTTWTVSPLTSVSTRQRRRWRPAWILPASASSSPAARPGSAWKSPAFWPARVPQ